MISKKMQKEVRLNRGTLTPDLDNETYKDRVGFNHYNTRND
jgi:hypothetical protein